MLVAVIGVGAGNSKIALNCAKRDENSAVGSAPEYKLLIPRLIIYSIPLDIDAFLTGGGGAGAILPFR